MHNLHPDLIWEIQSMHLREVEQQIAQQQMAESMSRARRRRSAWRLGLFPQRSRGTYSTVCGWWGCRRRATFLLTRRLY